MTSHQKGDLLPDAAHGPRCVILGELTVDDALAVVADTQAKGFADSAQRKVRGTSRVVGVDIRAADRVVFDGQARHTHLIIVRACIKIALYELRVSASGLLGSFARSLTVAARFVSPCGRSYHTRT